MPPFWGHFLWSIDAARRRRGGGIGLAVYPQGAIKLARRAPMNEVWVFADVRAWASQGKAALRIERFEGV